MPSSNDHPTDCNRAEIESVSSDSDLFRSEHPLWHKALALTSNRRPLLQKHSPSCAGDYLSYDRVKSAKYLMADMLGRKSIHIKGRLKVASCGWTAGVGWSSWREPTRPKGNMQKSNVEPSYCKATALNTGLERNTWACKPFVDFWGVYVHYLADRYHSISISISKDGSLYICTELSPDILSLTLAPLPKQNQNH